MNESRNESNGIRLLKHQYKGIVQALFGRLGIVLLLLVVQVLFLFSIFRWFENFLPHFYGGTVVFMAIILLYLLNTSSIDPTAKITWLVIIMLMPIFGALLLLYTQSDIGHRALKKREEVVIEESKKYQIENQGFEKMKENHGSSVALAQYLKKYADANAYENCSVTYFPLGEDKFRSLLTELKNAKHFIFLEYFIIDEGLMWGKVLEILAEKVQEGVEVRVMYDGTNEFSTLPRDYPKRLQELGIKCKVFAPFTPFVSTHYNYRDHRKIVVIDGHTAYTGGINLADEYINQYEKYGHWKDTAIMVKGEAVRNFTMLFLQMWNITEKDIVFEPYLSYPCKLQTEIKGYVIPYGDRPLDQDKVGEMVYMDILNRAKKYVHIMSPYLILDGELETALKFAAQRGVDVKLILPGIPDKKIPYALAKTHYKTLLDAGVHIYEYTPGFVHAKVFVSDDQEGVIGTINLDYRSLYHHYECATYLVEIDCLKEIEQDFQNTLLKCRKVTYETIQKEKLRVKIMGVLMKAIAPLM